MFRSKTSNFMPKIGAAVGSMFANAARTPQRSQGGFRIAKTMAAGAKSPMMKKGGYVKAADGCAKRGKTKGRMV